MPSTDLATPPPRGLSKLRRLEGGSNHSTNSLVSSSNSDDPNTDPNLQQLNTEGGTGKLMDRLRRKSIQDDSRRGSKDTGKRISVLLPGRKNKLKKQPSSEQLERHLSTDSGAGNLALARNQSDSSLGQDGSGHSSLLSDDISDHEG